MAPKVTTEAERAAAERTIFAIGSEIGDRMAESFEALLGTQHPESTVKAWGRSFRENFNRVLSMTPAEYEVYRKQRDREERQRQLQYERQRVRSKFSKAWWDAKSLARQYIRFWRTGK